MSNLLDYELITTIQDVWRRNGSSVTKTAKDLNINRQTAAKYIHEDHAARWHIVVERNGVKRLFKLMGSENRL